MNDLELQEKVNELAQGEPWSIQRTVDNFISGGPIRNRVRVHVFKTGYTNGTITAADKIWATNELDSNEEAYMAVLALATEPGQEGLGTHPDPRQSEEPLEF